MSFPHPVFETLLLKLASALEIAQKESTTNTQARQALYHATTDFKDSIAKAKQLVAALPGGELLLSDQTSVIKMLEDLRDTKQLQLSKFSSQALASHDTNNTASFKMEIDSTASSPHD